MTALPKIKPLSIPLAATLLSALVLSASAQSPTPDIHRSGGKNRIVFDNFVSPTPDATPAATPVPAPTPTASVPPVLVEEPLTSDPTPDPTPWATPPPQAEATQEAESLIIKKDEQIAGAATESAPSQESPTIAAESKSPAEIQNPKSEIQNSPTPPTPAQAIAETAAQEPPPTAGEDAFSVVGIEGALPSSSQTDVLADSENIDLIPISSVDGGTMPPSQSVTVNLINKLVQRGILTKEDATGMIKQAEAEAEVARAQSQADMFAVAQIAAAQAASDQIAIDQALAAPSEDDVRVTFIPDPVRTQIKEDIKSELRDEMSRKPFQDLNVLPLWASRINPYGDIRVRFEGILNPEGNDSSGAFPDFNAINTGSPFDVTGNEFSPQYNTDQDRYRMRLRARLGFTYEMTDGFEMGFRLATGNDSSPVSTNQTLGRSGGQFSKYAIWLDRAYVQWTAWGEPTRNFTFTAGRFKNPFFSTQLIWDDDINFDGAAASLKYEVFPGLRPFLVGGAFPVYNTDLNFSTNQPTKFKSYDKYLFAIQGGLEWEFADNWNFKVGAAYYYFQNIEGKLSSPFTPLNSSDAGDTDNSRPSFAQKGNTYFPIRNIVADASNDFGAINQYQYYGLATKYEELAITARLEYNGFEPIQVSLTGEFVTNLAWNEDDINAIAVNNRGAIDPNNIDDIFGQYEGSNYAWLMELRVGHPRYLKRWDWSAHFSYRWIGSDAVVDGFNDSDFGLGGTNMQGFTVAGFVALAPNVWVGGRWLGSDSIAGPQFNVNIFQVELNGEF